VVKNGTFSSEERASALASGSSHPRITQRGLVTEDHHKRGTRMQIRSILDPSKGARECAKCQFLAFCAYFDPKWSKPANCSGDERASALARGSSLPRITQRGLVTEDHHKRDPRMYIRSILDPSKRARECVKSHFFGILCVFCPKVVKNGKSLG